MLGARAKPEMGGKVAWTESSLATRDARVLPAQRKEI